MKYVYDTVFLLDNDPIYRANYEECATEGCELELDDVIYQGVKVEPLSLPPNLQVLADMSDYIEVMAKCDLTIKQTVLVDIIQV